MNAYKAAQKIWRDLYLLCNYVGAWEIKIHVGLLLPFLPSPAPTPGLLILSPIKELLAQRLRLKKTKRKEVRGRG